jgi:diacylglycerol kinase family enzyme
MSAEILDETLGAAQRAKLGRICVVANCASGSVGPGAVEEVRAILESFGLAADIAAPEPAHLVEALKTAIARKPHLLIVLAGDGTARAAASLCGPDGPLIAPLPGGTMNMLPHALYGQRNWQTALKAILEDGVEQPVAGGSVGGQDFCVAAILGSPALWGLAREAVRRRKLKLFLVRARRALRRAFTTKLRYSLDGAAPKRAEALVLMCPLVSKAMTEQTSLEAAAVNPHQPAEVVRLGARALAGELFGDMVGGWRDDATVNAGPARRARIWASEPIPAILDGEPVKFAREVEVLFRPVAFRALVPREASPPATPKADPGMSNGA